MHHIWSGVLHRTDNSCTITTEQSICSFPRKLHIYMTQMYMDTVIPNIYSVSLAPNVRFWFFFLQKSNKLYLTSLSLPILPFYAFYPQIERISFLFVGTLGQSSQNWTFFSRHSREICGFLQYKQRSLHFQYSPWGMRCPTLALDTQGWCQSKQPVPKNNNNKLLKKEISINDWNFFFFQMQVWCFSSKNLQHDFTVEIATLILSLFGK